jgi:ribosomal protein L11 methyltransferase
VLAVDIDAVAVRAAQSNAEQNSVSDNINIRRGSLSARAQRMHRREFDIALANITSQAISGLSAGLCRVLKPGGVLISSGIHELGLDQVLISLSLAGFKLQSIVQEGEWFAVVAVA